MSETKKNLLIRLIAIVAITIILGIVLLLLDGSMITSFLFILLGGLLLIDGIIGLVNDKFTNKYFIISNIISIVLGLLLMFNFHNIINIIIAIWFIAFPIVDIIKDKTDKKETFKKQLPKMIVGLIIILFGIGGFVDILLKIVGWCSIAFGVIYLILGLISLSKHN